MEDRIYRSLRTAQERAENHPPEEAATPASAPNPEPAEGHAAHPGKAPIRPASLMGFRWFARGSGRARPRISIVGTLSLSVLISAGFFAAHQLMVTLRHKHHADQSVAADSGAQLRMASRQDDIDDEAQDQVSVPSRFHHVHAPSAHHQTHSTHAVALEEEPASEENGEQPSAAPKGKLTSNSHRVQHAADDADSVQLEGDNSSRPTSAPVAAASQRAPVSPLPEPGLSPAANATDHSSSPSSVGSVAGQNAQPAVQPLPATGNQAMNASGNWPVVPSAAPAAVQVSAEAPNAPSLTIVPGHPDNLSLPPGPSAAQIPVVPPQTPVNAAAHSVEPTAAGPVQTSNAYGGYQDHVEAATQAQSGASPLEPLDRTKVMSFQFRNAPWTLVLAKFATATGLELRLQAMPDGTFNRWDSARYSPSQTLAILNSELLKLGCQAKIVGGALYVVPATSADAAVPAANPSNVVTPTAATSSQMPQFPGVPAAATTTPAAR